MYQENLNYIGWYYSIVNTSVIILANISYEYPINAEHAQCKMYGGWAKEWPS